MKSATSNNPGYSFFVTMVLAGIAFGLTTVF